MIHSNRRAWLLCSLVAIALWLAPPDPARVLAGQASEVLRVPSKDGTPIAVECAGSGPTLVIVHGGVGDRSRWTPMFPLLSSRWTVCAMDRRGHGESGDSPDYSLRKEAEDVAAVVESRRGTVFLLGHSYGAVCALEATFLTKKVARLLLYEPPLMDRPDDAVLPRIEKQIQDGHRDQAVATFLKDVVLVPPAQLDAMRSRPEWSHLVASADALPRQIKALGAYRLDAKRMSTMTVPTLLIKGSDTAIPDVDRAITSLMATLPNRTQVVLKGQQHNAMDTGRQQLADAIAGFLSGAADQPRADQPPADHPQADQAPRK